MQQMKPLLKFAALLVISALVILPALASLPCAFGATASCAPACPMAMNSMGPNCPMSAQLSATDCPQNCCTQAPTEVMAALATQEKSRFIALAPSPVLPAASHVSLSDRAELAPIEPQFAPPPRYILIQNFRI
jgi:hypothetical protein